MLSFTSFINEAKEDEKAEAQGVGKNADIQGFLDKINNSKTESGLDELKKYYDSRKKEVMVKDSDDITIRDAIDGRREEIQAMYDEEEETAEEV